MSEHTARAVPPLWGGSGICRANSKADRRAAQVRRNGPKHPGFTLVEMLIIAVILGLLASVAFPYLRTGTDDGRRSALAHTVEVVRGAILRHQLQHGGKLPGTPAQHTEDGSTFAPHLDPEDAFIKQLMCYSNADGDTCARGQMGLYPLQPYLKGKFPPNSLAFRTALGGEDRVRVVDDEGPLTADLLPTTGWKYSRVTGAFIPNNPNLKLGLTPITTVDLFTLPVVPDGTGNGGGGDGND